MFYLGEAVDKFFLVSIQKMLIQPTKTFVYIYERDGSCLSAEVHPSFSCSCVRNGEGSLPPDKEPCYGLMSQLPKELLEKDRIVRIKCPCGLDLLIIPIKYSRNVIGYISIGIPTATFHNNSIPTLLDTIKPSLSEPVRNSFSLEIRKILTIQLKEACRMISTSYSKKIKCQLGNSILSYEDYQSLFKSVINESPGCITVLKKVGNDLKIVFGNRLTLEYFRVNSLDEIKGKSLKDILPEHGHLYAVLFRAIETGEPIRIKEFFFKDPYTNKTSWWNLCVAPYFENGKIIGGICIRNEITEHVLARNKLQDLSNEFQEKSSQLEAVIDNMSEGLVFCDKSSNYVMWNKAALKLLNLGEKIKKLEETKKYFSLKEISGKAIPLENYSIPRIFRGETIKDLVVRVETKNNSSGKRVLLFNGKPIYDKDNNFMFGISTFSDITAINEQNKKIEEQWSFINRSLDQLETPVFVITYPDLKFVLVNKQTSLIINSIFGKKVNKDGLINQGISSVLKLRGILTLENINNIEKFFLLLGKSNNELVNNVHTINLVINKKPKYFTVITTPMHNSNKETTHIICSAFEITSSMEYSKKLEEMSRLKEEFFANMSHEFRTPLTVILGALQMLSCIDPSADPKEFQVKTTKYLAIMKQNCHRLVKLINNLLDVTRINSDYLLLCLQNIDIVALVKEITMSVSDYVSQKKLSLQFSSNVKEKIISVDIDKIERILLNLLSNAVKFTLEGNKIFVSLKDKGSYVEIRVKDTGIGIPQEKLDIIFERFRQVDNVLTRKNEGSGLGLSLVKSLVEMHNGKISVKSRVGKGTEFIIIFPVSPSSDFSQTPSTLPHDRDINEVINIEFSDLNLK